MAFRHSGKLMAAAGVLCFALAFVLLGSFKGEFGKDTAGKSSVPPMMQDTIDVTPSKTAADGPDDAPKQIAATEPNADENGAKWVVYVTGAVKRPGVYEVAPGARVYEALKAAGGFSDSANQEAVNLAAKLQDGQQIKFLKKGETAAAAAPAQADAATVRQAPQSAELPPRININTAQQSELETIRGVGPKTAQAIIEYRTANGPFARAEEIMNVKGIGPKKYDAMKERISAGN